MRRTTVLCPILVLACSGSTSPEPIAPAAAPAKPAAGPRAAVGAEPASAGPTNREERAGAPSSAPTDPAVEPAAPPSPRPLPCVDAAAVATLAVTPLPFDGTVEPSEHGPAADEQSEQVRAAALSMGMAGAVIAGEYGYGIAYNFEYSFHAWIQVAERDPEDGELVAKQEIPLPGFRDNRYQAIEATSFVADKNRDGNPELWLRYTFDLDEKASRGHEMTESFLSVFSVPDAQLLLHIGAGSHEKRFGKGGYEPVSERTCESAFAVVDVGCDRLGDLVIDETCTATKCAEVDGDAVCTPAGPPAKQRTTVLWDDAQRKFSTRSTRTK